MCAQKCNNIDSHRPHMIKYNNKFSTILVLHVLQMTSIYTILTFFLHFQQYSKIGLAAYDANWYDLSGNKAVSLVMIITMSHYPPKLTAGKFVDLSINTFGVVSFLYYHI